jgi:hypothetical protein
MGIGLFSRAQPVNETIDDVDDRVHYSGTGNLNGNWTHENDAVHAYNGTQSSSVSAGS